MDGFVAFGTHDRQRRACLPRARIRHYVADPRDGARGWADTVGWSRVPEVNLSQVENLMTLLKARPLPRDVRRLHTSRENLQSTLYVSVRILRSLRDHAAAYRAAYVPRDERLRIQRELAPLVRAAYGDDAMLTGRRLALGDLEDEIRRHASNSVPVMALSRIVAECLDKEYGDHFWEQIRRYYNLHESTQGRPVKSQRLTIDDPVPVCASIFGGTGPDRGTNPRNLPRWRSPERIGHFVLAPAEVKQFEVHLNFELTKELNALQPAGQRVAVVSPSDHSDDFAWDTDEHKTRYWNVHPRGKSDKPRGHPRARSAADYRSLLQRGVDTAIANNTRLVVLPELSMTPKEAENLADYWQQQQPSQQDAGERRVPTILVAGSYHEPGESTHNVATIVGRSARFPLYKATPHVYRPRRTGQAPEHPPTSSTEQGTDESDDEERFEIVESIIQRDEPEVTVFCGRHVTLAVVVCVDFLMDALRDLLRNLDVGMVVVPSMTDKTNVFRRLIDGHVATTQGVVLLANGVQSRDEESRVTVGIPKDPYTISVTTDGKLAAQAGPGVAIIDLDNPDASEWISLKPGKAS